MFRTLEVDIDSSTWPTPPSLPAFPASFHTGATTETMSVLGMLLMIGYLTAPTSLTGFSLSEFWAQLRYLGAFSTDADMRLTSAYAGLDAHQKTILSDDFGMGVPMLWLEDRLSLEEIVDGRYFLQFVAASVGARDAGRAALPRGDDPRGPALSPRLRRLPGLRRRQRGGGRVEQAVEQPGLVPQLLGHHEVGLGARVAEEPQFGQI